MPLFVGIGIAVAFLVGMWLLGPGLGEATALKLAGDSVERWAQAKQLDLRNYKTPTTADHADQKHYTFVWSPRAGRDDRTIEVTVDRKTADVFILNP